MKKHTTICLLIFMSFTCQLNAQRITNWNADVSFHSWTGYDFDLNKPVGMLIPTYVSFKININGSGTGIVYLLKSDNNQKLIYNIDYATHKEYTDGGEYIEINTHNENGDFIVRVTIKTKRKKTIIKKIALIASNHQGSLFY